MVAVKVKVIVLPDKAEVGTVYEVERVLVFEKLPVVADQETLVCPCALPVKLMVCPGHAVTGEVPASTVKGAIGAIQPLLI